MSTSEDPAYIHALCDALAPPVNSPYPLVVHWLQTLHTCLWPLQAAHYKSGQYTHLYSIHGSVCVHVRACVCVLPVRVHVCVCVCARVCERERVFICLCVFSGYEYAGCCLQPILHSSYLVCASSLSLSVLIQNSRVEVQGSSYHIQCVKCVYCGSDASGNAKQAPPFTYMHSHRAFACFSCMKQSQHHSSARTQSKGYFSEML